MMELNQYGEVQHINRVAKQLFTFRDNERPVFSSLGLITLEGETLDWDFLLENISYLPKVIKYLADPHHEPYLFSLSVEMLETEAAPNYFLLLSPIPNHDNNIETYRLAEEKFYKAFHLSPDAISITRLADGMFLEVNEGFINLTGYQREELIGKTVLDIKMWYSPEERAEMRKGLVQEGKSFREAVFRIKGGELAEGQINARVIVIDGERCQINVVRDLRKQKQIERSLREREKQLQLINRATNDAIWDWNLVTDNLVWNDGLERIFGYTPNQVNSTIQWWEDRIHSEDRQRVMERIELFIQKKEENWFDKYRFLRSDGSYAYVYDKGNITLDEDHRAVRMIGGMVDITDRVLAEESLIIRNQQIAEYAFFNSHKVRAPLARLLGLTSLLQNDLEPNSERRELIGKVRLVAEEIDEMIKEITKIFY
ncbi:MAG: PAS domain S-box protein [Bacteroidota bacterium]